MTRRWIMMLALALWAGLPACLPGELGGGAAAWAKGGDRDGGGHGSDRDADRDDDDDDDDDDDGDGDDDGGGAGEDDGNPGAGRPDPARDGKAGGGFGGDGIHLFHADGSAESLRGGIYERRDARGRVRDRRPGTQADLGRLSAYRDLIRDPARRGDAIGVAVVSGGQGRVQIIDSSGWTETLSGGTYQLADPNGNRVTRRSATPRDLARIRAALGL
ncbi:hypothetical protein RNZ50_14585 [Paracoccaceae bacterium Fryx2]|nr:hypothetical protein [Paracoccaceae bacterium Fryx2]